MNKKTLTMNLGCRSYDITIGKALLTEADKYFNLNRKVMIVTDSGVPSEYAKSIASVSKDSRIFTVPMGEGSKSLASLEAILSEMLSFEITRTDCVVAVGGGVVGDLAGFAASVFMRGIDFYNVPTTVLSQVDSSIGGKTAINLNNVKNIVGAFHQPKGVLIDVDTLKTLSQRHISEGLAESVKMALTSDRELFEFLENNDVDETNIEHVITASLLIKKSVVEQDEKETGLRKILNFGHTLGHGIEADSSGALFHGEAVALGMMPVCSAEVQKRLVEVLKRLNLPYNYSGSIDNALSFISHDKKCSGEKIDIIFVDNPGSCRIEKILVSDFKELIKQGKVFSK